MSNQALPYHIQVVVGLCVYDGDCGKHVKLKQSINFINVSENSLDD